MHHQRGAWKEQGVWCVTHPAPTVWQFTGTEPGPTGINNAAPPGGGDGLDNHALDAFNALARHAAKADVDGRFTCVEPGIELRVQRRWIVEEDEIGIRETSLPRRVGREQDFVRSDDERVTFDQVVPEVIHRRQTKTAAHRVQRIAKEQVAQDVVDAPDQIVKPARQAVPRNVGWRVQARWQQARGVEHAEYRQFQMLGDAGCGEGQSAIDHQVGALADGCQPLRLQRNLHFKVTDHLLEHPQGLARHDLLILGSKHLHIVAESGKVKAESANPVLEVRGSGNQGAMTARGKRLRQRQHRLHVAA